MNEMSTPKDLLPDEITYDHVAAYHAEHCDDWQKILDKFEKQIIVARNKGLPVYSTKCRVKTADSIYLKTKRKNIGLSAITDYSGLRILCLFEECLFKVHKKIIELIHHNKCDLLQFKMYNFSNELMSTKFMMVINDFFPDFHTTQPASKLSGYKSIHYVVMGNSFGSQCPLEIQLRTLLQDVWGELEHELAYKRGIIHPHIKKSFTLLARDIETNDILMSHLNEIHNKEMTKDRYGIKKTGLKHYFKYEEDIFPSQLKDPRLSQFLNDYVATMVELTKNKHLAGESRIDDAEAKFTALKREILHLFTSEAEDDDALHYWINMEKTLLRTTRSEFDDALTDYLNLAARHPSRYVLFFRIGELFLINGEITKALRAFDKSETILQRQIDTGSQSPVLYQNLVLIKRKLAYTYWMLGDEYIDQTLTIIKNVESIFLEKSDCIENLPEEMGTLLNNICWYQMQKWQSLLKDRDNLQGEAYDKKDLEVTEHKGYTVAAYKKLEDAIDESKRKGVPVPSNWLDTAAYFNYCSYLESRDPKFKALAQKYATECDQGTNYATLSLTSLSIQINHITDIMSLD